MSEETHAEALAKTCAEQIEEIQREIAEMKMAGSLEPPSPLARRIERVICDRRGAWVVSLGMLLASTAAVLIAGAP